MLIFDQKPLYTPSLDVLECLEGELRASAAGHPAAWDDLTTYLRYDMLDKNLEEHILKENGKIL